MKLDNNPRAALPVWRCPLGIETAKSNDDIRSTPHCSVSSAVAHSPPALKQFNGQLFYTLFLGDTGGCTFAVAQD
jgi:hypothetical protein